MSSDFQNEKTPASGSLTISDVRVLNEGEPAREVAKQLGLELQDILPLVGDKPVVVVVSEPAEVLALLEVENRSWIGCVIAWQLPEASVELLFELGVTVFVGLPKLQQVLTAMEYLPDADVLGEARSLAGRLATIEALLDRHLFLGQSTP
jgi:hypothetical protein